MGPCQAGSSCLVYDAFEAVDGGHDRVCRGVDSAEVSASDYVQHEQVVPDLRDCKIQCAMLAGCKGISFSDSAESYCQLWIRNQGIQSSVALPGSKCLRYMPFTGVNLPGADQACLGTGQGSLHAYTLEEVPSLELCRVRCVETAGCKAVDFGALGCRVWTEEIERTEHRKGSACLRHGMSIFANASAFKPVDGGTDRACRGMNESDNLDSYYTLFWSWPENSSISACQDRCVIALFATAIVALGCVCHLPEHSMIIEICKAKISMLKNAKDCFQLGVCFCMFLSLHAFACVHLIVGDSLSQNYTLTSAG